MIKIGLTGAIGSGKSSIAKKASEDLGIPVFDADDVVHQLYEHDKDLQNYLVSKCSDDILQDGKLDRKKLSVFMRDPSNRDTWKEIEKEVHKRVWDMYQCFVEKHEKGGKQYVIADIPLLFEIKLDKFFDYTVNVSASYEIQKQRALARENPKITEADFERRYKVFMPTSERNKKANFVVDNSGKIEDSMKQLSLHLANMSDKAAISSNIPSEKKLIQARFENKDQLKGPKI